jgi:hypothetical protein
MQPKSTVYLARKTRIRKEHRKDDDIEAAATTTLDVVHQGADGLDGVLQVPGLVPSPLHELPVPLHHLPVRRSQQYQPRQEDRRRRHGRRREPQAAVVAQGQLRETMRLAPDLLRLRVVLAVVLREALHERERRGPTEAVVERGEQHALRAVVVSPQRCASSPAVIHPSQAAPWPSYFAATYSRHEPASGGRCMVVEPEAVGAGVACRRVRGGAGVPAGGTVTVVGRRVVSRMLEAPVQVHVRSGATASGSGQGPAGGRGPVKL